MLIEILRLETSPYGTLNALRLNGQWFGATLEPPHMQNKVNESCIPAGQYWARKYNSPKHGLVWRLEGVPGRSYIEFHAGNVLEHTAGCFLTGESQAKLRGPADHTKLVNSGATFEKFMEALEEAEYHKVTVKNAY